MPNVVPELPGALTAVPAMCARRLYAVAQSAAAVVEYVPDVVDCLREVRVVSPIDDQVHAHVRTVGQQLPELPEHRAARHLGLVPAIDARRDVLDRAKRTTHR